MRWYIHDWPANIERVRVQVDMVCHNKRSYDMPKELIEIAGREYEKQFSSQTFEQVCQRGGLSFIEVVCLMGDAYNRLKNGSL